jgi:leucyl aminopeptidase
MRVRLEPRPATAARAHVLVLGRHADEPRPGGELRAVDAALGGQLARAWTEERFEGKPGQLCALHTGGRLACRRVLVVGLGPRASADAETVRRGAALGARRARELGATSVALHLPAAGVPAGPRAQATVEGALLASYRFDRYLRDRGPDGLAELAVVEPERRQQAAAREGLRRGEVVAAATCLARDLVNEPANVVTPSFLAETARRIAREGRLRVRVLEREDCARLGMGAYLGVAQGSQEPPKFIHLTYVPRGRARRRVALVGKGITFDSGGLDLKTAEGMLRMKGDMAGAAAVLGVFSALPRLRPAVEVHGLIAATENMPSGSAQRPGDVVRTMAGLSVEIGNTDAEGRLTLADALTYAVRRVGPDEIIDLATLTGAVVQALGLGISGVFASDGLADRVLAAAAGAGERMWRLPLADEYREAMKSDVADLNNVSGQRGGGAVYAAVFLREFTEGRPWAHLDIAGTAFTERELPLGPKGGTGVGVRTLLAYLDALGRGGRRGGGRPRRARAVSAAPRRRRGV